MPDEIISNDSDSPVDSIEETTQKPAYITAADLDSKLSEIEQMLNKAVNGVSKKFNTKLMEITTQLQQSSQPQTEVHPQTESTEANLTVTALKKDYDKKLQQLADEYKQSMESLRSELSAKEKAEFNLKLESKLSALLAANKLDDIESARTVFLALYPLDKFSAGEKNIILYRADDSDDDVNTLESLVEGWVKSPMGKRFSPIPKLPNGTGTKETQKLDVVETITDKPLSRTEQLLQKATKSKK